ncbi:MAG TPA: alanine--tRNA ligase [Myxococcota bacterium]|nr:alanine--tRNA ligase [Myxococcota bacterium]
MASRWPASEIRESFLRFFEEHGHRRVASSSLVPQSDPTLLFTNAGMVQFKRAFLGEEVRPYTRAATAQKCLRASGKHNDLEMVGRTARHNTFFEMLGNFSFGDYFKKEAIQLAWELVTSVWKLDPGRIVATVFREDDEAFELWEKEIGIPRERIFRLDEADNFWSMGDTGPCGPCSELNVDFGPTGACTNPRCDPTCDCGRWLEFWNLVFMQYDRDASGRMKPLPKPSVDTGAGLERVSWILQGARSVYETDLFTPLLARAQELSGVELGADPAKDVSLRVVADHARAVTFLIGDGVLPSNEGRGYVLRRILRRAARHGVLLGVEEPFLFRVAETVIDEMRGAYPELAERREFIRERVRREEERFLETLGKGLALLQAETARVKARGVAVVPGDVVFRLYDTFGFPVDLTEDILRGEGLRIDQAGFDAAMAGQRERGRAAWKGSGQESPGELWERLAAQGRVAFRGYDTLATSSPIRALLVNGATARTASEGDAVEIVVEETPFYPEGGGQVGDRGTLTTPSGRVRVETTLKPVEGLIVQRGRVEQGEIHVDETAELRVDPAARAGAVRHHSGTHLLHAALREVLGRQAVQRGSLVAPDRLRFDFTHDTPVTPAEIQRIEDLVNGWIEANAPARVEEMPHADALAAGAIAMFGEKYGDRVRVVGFGDFSLELCGGTHAGATGEVGLLKVVSEGGVAAGVRRVEALTGRDALERWRSEERTLLRAAELLRTTPAELTARVEKLLDERRALEKELDELRSAQRRAASGDLLSQAREVGGVRVLAARVDGVEAKDLRSMVDDLRAKLGSGIVLLAAEREGQVSLALGVTKDLVAKHPAGELIREVAALVGGKGGGRPDFAQAGGRDAARLDQAFEKLHALVAAG